jgi:type IV secretion system protein VirB9
MAGLRRWVVCSSLLWGSLLGCASLPPAQPLELTPPPLPPAVVLPHGPKDVWVDEPEGALVGTVSRGNRQARLRPTRQGFQQGLMRFPFRPFALYQIATAVDHETRLFLAPGERLIYFGLADTKRWVAEETHAGEGETQQTVLIIKPTAAKLKTTGTLTTNLGAYLLEFMANHRTYLAAVAWRQTPKQEAALVQGEPTGTRYQLRLMRGDVWPAWTPVRAWHTTTGKTFIQCQDAMRFQESPVIYALSATGERQRVNHWLRGVTFELERLSQVWVLQYGDEETGTVVRVEQVHP